MKKFTQRWINYYFDIAERTALLSYDPSTKVGAVIVDPNRRIVGIGYNGFPEGVKDSPERYADKETKHGLVVHAEQNALLNSNKSVKGCILFVTPLSPCKDCAKVIVQAGIKEVYAKMKRQNECFKYAEMMFSESSVKFHGYKL